jgi:hypothetical protein
MEEKMKKFKTLVWLALQPNGVVYVTNCKPEKGDDDFYIDDNSHDFLVVRNAFGLTKKQPLRRAKLDISAMKA